ncbi:MULTISPECIES: methylenetetrahydrofolate--tRNA-(uracil(54)-C(5))-methyltransferase (FADH(2)-oxidizing) TrmFO [Halobacteriovorax]|uniref:Methylenetetrahydrofolate--tRNA-(uracil-5-)-methyltransferase TrmFO n=1 Tax=Halobacteriovorax vibrionivorans TaxID=2152716 RepID=A0ABY0IEI9_9BACT|nr:MULTISPECIES: methylenetetrahydrofolate--tRNA-(uracil(54)-C(5))-methyltransferase (FADH(2)-oxidizing) TrmFO [Halobacteriovorax]RZF20944.1 methylenetetrahydrofolate--tRNA-(uracil(54)-C(5))-methyltransferase (FADH(2)-oxidizing) TrmFO [Halobacteriovorax vibrionivorans]TGD46044.1 methylenetetrahydrofolate--tRNA-(uracil(54)-C(5))-methyltransferase (FADH(2)-oxidizing) TrmFO [Halobacteriovorax sp. Y22]
MSNSHKVIVIGAGMAGSEAANFLASQGVKVVLVESKTVKKNPAQKIDAFAELVCTNSLKSMNPASGHGLLKYEMDALGSIILDCARKHAVPAGDALAVERDGFSGEVTDRLHNHENIEVVAMDASDPQELMAKYEADACVIASGPLTTEGLSNWIVKNISDDDFYFYDAIAPVVDGDSLDYSKLYYKDRHKPVSEEEGEQADYLNAPMNKEQYEDFIAELVKAEKVPAQNFEDYKFFESCLPVDIMAERGVDTARFSCMKPIGLELPDGSLPYACVQLRRENLLGSAFNMVGFQTRLKYPEQKRVFSKIPGFENASFLHLGSVHRNSFINSRTLLDFDLSVKKFPNIYFAGQITGVEGYTESASMGLYVAFQLLKKLRGEEVRPFPVETGMGALVNYVMTVPKPVPSNINFGLLPPVALTKEQRRDRKNRKKVKKQLASDRAKESFDNFMKEYNK